MGLKWMDPEKTRKEEEEQRQKTTKVKSDTIGSKLVHVTSELHVLCSSHRVCFVSLTGVGLVTGTSLQHLVSFCNDHCGLLAVLLL